MSTLPLPEAIYRFKANDERVDILVNGSDTDTWTTSGGDVMPSLAKFLKETAADVDSIRDQLGIYLGYSLVIESSLGTAFRVGEGRVTVLTARVFRNGEEITDEVPATWFRWRRRSMIEQPYPNDDATWNSQFQGGGYKTLSITVDVVFGRATFFCDLQPPA